MRQVHCDGCGFKEPEDLPPKKKKIVPVTFSAIKDPRWPDTLIGKDKYEADLCPECLALLLHQYFKVPMVEHLELDVPTFIQPEDIPEPQSLRVMEGD